MKLLAIGLGKQKGADTFHGRSFAEFPTLIPAVGRFTLQHVPIPFGLALVEDGHSRLSLVEAVPADSVWEREQELLKIARDRMARLPGEKIDVLIVDQLGKDISGIGADTNVINRYWQRSAAAASSHSAGSYARSDERYGRQRLRNRSGGRGSKADRRQVGPGADVYELHHR